MKPKYSELHSLIANDGHDIDSRLGMTREILNAQVIFAAGEMVGRRGFNRQLGFLELLCVIAGIHEPELISRVAPKADISLFTTAMSYGPRIARQVPRVLDLLQKDRNTRQAVLYIGSGEDTASTNLPCTSTMQILWRGHCVHAIVTMRSWDSILGLPYDVMVFGGLLQAIAHCLYTSPGAIVVNAGSLHEYLKYPTSWLEGHDSMALFTIRAYMPRTWSELAEYADEQAHLAPWATKEPAMFKSVVMHINSVLSRLIREAQTLDDVIKLSESRDLSALERTQSA